MNLGKGRSSLIQRLHVGKTRAREGLVLVEGVRSVMDALECGVSVRFAVVSPRGRELGGAELEEVLAALPADVVEVEDREFADLAATETAQGVLLVVPEPEPVLPTGARRVLVLDGVQDPGNVGTLIRTGAGLGVDAVVALDGTADPWNAKAVRATAGACFRVPVVRMPWDDFHGAWPGAVVVADATGHPVTAGGTGVSAPWALVIGSEGSGPRADVSAAADHRLAIPLQRGVESLNAGVAGALLLHELVRGDRT